MFDFSKPENPGSNFVKGALMAMGSAVIAGACTFTYLTNFAGYELKNQQEKITNKNSKIEDTLSKFEGFGKDETPNKKQVDKYFSKRFDTAIADIDGDNKKEQITKLGKQYISENVHEGGKVVFNTELENPSKYFQEPSKDSVQSTPTYAEIYKKNDSALSYIIKTESFQNDR